MYLLSYTLSLFNGTFSFDNFFYFIETTSFSLGASFNPLLPGKDLVPLILQN